MTSERHDDDRVWRLEKSKDGEDGLEHGFRLETVPIGIDEDGDELTSCVIEQDELSRSAREKPLTVNQQLGLDSLSEAATQFAGPVHVEIWRAAFYRRSTADKPDTKRKQFDRVRRDLVKFGKVQVSNDVYQLTIPIVTFDWTAPGRVT